MITILLFITFSKSLYSQNNMIKNFELLYSIPQEINDNEEWPKYTLRSLYLENDTLHTLLLKTNYISSISLSDSLAKIKHLFTPLPKNEFPVFLKKYQQEWYTASTNSIQKFQNSSQYQTLITIPQETLLEFFDIIENKIIYATRQPKIVLTDLDGKELFQVSINYFFISTTVYNNILTNGFYDILIKKNLLISLPVKRHYTSSAYPNATYMIGGWEKYGYFVDPTQRDHLVIRDMSGNSEEECLYFNHTFSENDLDFPEEDDINLRVFSSNNQIFYFVQVKNEHLDIYKAAK